MAEKIIATRIAYFAENLLYGKEILDHEQIEDWKQKSTIDAALNLVHNAQMSKNRDNTLLCLLIDVKEAFDHVSLTQLINVLKRLDISRNIVDWVTCFLQERVISLAFDGNKQKPKQIAIEIFPESPILSILFLIYIRFLFLQIRARYDVSTSSYIDDVAIYVEGRDIVKNVTIFQSAIDIAFL